GPFRARRDTRTQRRAAKCRARRVSARLDRIDQRGDPRPLSDWTWASWCGKSHTHTGLAHGGGAWVGQPERRGRGPCGGGVVPVRHSYDPTTRTQGDAGAPPFRNRRAEHRGDPHRGGDRVLAIHRRGMEQKQRRIFDTVKPSMRPMVITLLKDLRKAMDDN